MKTKQRGNRMIWLFLGITLTTTGTILMERGQGAGQNPKEAVPPDQAQPGDVWKNPKDGSEMVFVPAGEFMMGISPAQEDELRRLIPDLDDAPNAFVAEQPQHTVYLDAYWIDKTEVTNAQFAQFVYKAKYRVEGFWQREAGKELHPAIGVTWNDAMAYAEWAGKRLPTEAEWEKAARGVEGRFWPWGNTWDETKCVYSEVAPVGSFPQGASPYGCLDMAGNAWEWCIDWYDYNYYSECEKKGVVRNPTGPKEGGNRILRGGAWGSTLEYLVLAAGRYSLPPREADAPSGFRCVKTSLNHPLTKDKLPKAQPEEGPPMTKGPPITENGDL